MRTRIIGLALTLTLALSGAARAAVIDFTGGTAYLSGGGSVVLSEDYTPALSNVDYYIEDGVLVDFIGGVGYIGSYYDWVVGDTTNNNVIHAHWDEAAWTGLTAIRFSMVDDSAFDLNYMDLTSNTDYGGGVASGNELSYVTNDNGDSMLLPSSDWGVNMLAWGSSFPSDGIERLWMNADFDDILFFDVTSENAYCFGLDNFYINEPPPPPIPEPGTMLLLGTGFAGLAAYRRKKRAA